MTIKASDRDQHKTLVAAIGLVAGLAAPLVEAGDLVTGTPAEPSLALTLLRIAAAGWGLILLGAGIRIDRAVVATMLVVFGLALSAPLATKGLILTGMVALAILAVGLLLYLVIPRIFVAVACCWPLTFLYFAWLIATDPFSRSRTTMLVLAALGIAIAALLPKLGMILIATGLGLFLLRLASPFSWSFTATIVVALAAVGLQWWQLRRARQQQAEAAPAQSTVTERLAHWAPAFVPTAACLLGVALIVALLTPQYGPQSVNAPDPGRLTRLDSNGELERPGLVLSPTSNLYLSGRAYPLALVSTQPRFTDRLLAPITGRSIQSHVHDLRLVKDEEELSKLRRAAAITSLAFVDLKPFIHPGGSEAEVEQAILDSFARNGATGVAFKSIVGSGANALLPHYERNDADMSRGLVVIDIGCSVDGYASDMTRTFPVAGELTDAERTLTEVVIAAGDAARRRLKAGAKISELNRAARTIIVEAGFDPYILHGISHHVGVDVHDPHRNLLAAGMVITIEPGIYIPATAEIDPAYWDLGVRIEDSYIVTEEGYEEITSFPRYPVPVPD
jgi:Xaa-Pro aminopeptidase